MSKSLAIAAFLATAACSGAEKTAAPPPVSYAVLDQQAGPEGSYDYVSVDSAHGTLFVGREYGVMTVDLATGRQGRLIARDSVAAVLLIPGTDWMLTTNGGSNTATLLNRVTGAVTADIKTGEDPDGAAFDQASGLAFVMNGDSEDVTFIDVKRAAAVATVAVGGKPEAAVADGRGNLYVNIEDRNEIAVIDIAGRSVTRRIPLAGCNEPTGIAFDAQSGLLISACHNNVAKLIQADNGKDRGTIAIGQGADGSIFDPLRRLGYISCIDGTLTVYRLDGDGKASRLATVKTREGARTAALDLDSGRLYLPAATVVRDAEGEYDSARKDFTILTVGPKG